MKPLVTILYFLSDLEKLLFTVWNTVLFNKKLVGHVFVLLLNLKSIMKHLLEFERTFASMIEYRMYSFLYP